MKPSRPKRQFLLALLAGALLPLAFAPFHFYPLALLSPALLFVLWLDAGPRQAAWYGFAFGLGQFGVGVSWVYVAIHVFGNTPAIAAGLMTLLFVAFLALFPALTGFLAKRLLASRPLPAAAMGLLWLPAWWVLGEWVRGWAFTGFPWLNLGYSMIDAPLRGYAPLLGAYGVSLVAALSAGALALVWYKGLRSGPLTALLLLVLWGGGALLQAHQWTMPHGEAIRVSLVQGNVPQATKWDPVQAQRRLDVYASLTRSELPHSDLVVWPENSVTRFYHNLKEVYFDPLAEELRASATDLIAGVPELDNDARHYYTTLMTLGSSHRFYRKRHLVPFGEYVPFEGVLRGLVTFFDLPMSSFSAGSDEQPLLTAAGNRFAASVCYEDAFGEEMIEQLPQATLLVNGSNNAWYGDSLAPHQHLQISRMRALESGRPLLRATTNGISALVDERGVVQARSQQFEQQVVRGTVQPYAGSTPYIRYGNWPVLLLLPLLLSAAWLVRRQ